jgi:hypothetical protein
MQFFTLYQSPGDDDLSHTPFATKTRGVRFGRRPKLTPDQRRLACRTEGDNRDEKARKAPVPRSVVRTIHAQEPANIYCKLLARASVIGLEFLVPVREISMSFGRGTEGCHENGPVATITVLVVQLTPEMRCRLARPK